MKKQSINNNKDVNDWPNLNKSKRARPLAQKVALDREISSLLKNQAKNSNLKSLRKTSIVHKRENRTYRTRVSTLRKMRWLECSDFLALGHLKTKTIVRVHARLFTRIVRLGGNIGSTWTGEAALTVNLTRCDWTETIHINSGFYDRTNRFW